MEEAKLYDTSAVIELVARRRLQLVPGYVSILTIIEYPPAATHVLGILYPSKRDYALAVYWQTRLRRMGCPLPAVDLVIAAQAYNRGLTLVTLDKHHRILRDKVAPELRLEETV